MAIAAFKLNKLTSTGPTRTDSSKHPTFLASDVHTETASSFPIGRPLNAPASPKHSFETVLEWECTTAPDNQVNAIRVYGPSVRPDDPTDKLTVYWGLVVIGSYAAPISSNSTLATVRQDTNYFSNSDGPKENLDITVVPGDSIIDAVAERTNLLYTQLDVEFGAAAGNMVTQTYTFRYTES